jgi:hypothetical protein
LGRPISEFASVASRPTPVLRERELEHPKRFDRLGLSTGPEIVKAIEELTAGAYKQVELTQAAVVQVVAPAHMSDGDVSVAESGGKETSKMGASRQARFLSTATSCTSETPIAWSDRNERWNS